MTDWLQFTATGIADLYPYVPGKSSNDLEHEQGIRNSIKLASNENPLGPSQAATRAAQQSIPGAGFYPDDTGDRLREKLSTLIGLPLDGIILGAGSSDVINMVARCFLEPGTNAVFSQYCFAMYPIYTQACGAQSRQAKALPADHPDMPYGHDLTAMARLIDNKTRIVFIANPNNPTGTWLTDDALYAFIKQVPSNTLVVLDEAYSEYVDENNFPDGISWLNEFPNLVVCRTFSKIYGLAGLRIGYGITSPELACVIQRVRQPFNVCIPALAAAESALDDHDHLRRSREVNHKGMVQYEQGFAEMNLNTIPSVTNFITVDLGREAAPIHQYLLKKGIILRPLENYSMPNHLRISIGTEEQNAQCLSFFSEAIRSC